MDAFLSDLSKTAALFWLPLVVASAAWSQMALPSKALSDLAEQARSHAWSALAVGASPLILLDSPLSEGASALRALIAQIAISPWAWALTVRSGLRRAQRARTRPTP